MSFAAAANDERQQSSTAHLLGASPFVAMNATTSVLASVMTNAVMALITISYFRIKLKRTALGADPVPALSACPKKFT